LNTGEPINLLLRELGYSFTDDALLERALTHVSTDRHKSGNHNEVLEFLGDAVLDLAVSDLLIQHNPDKTEGDLSRMRAALVNSTVLAEKAGALNLGALLRVGKGEERSQNSDIFPLPPASIHAQ
jgi:ribonuclease-3